MKKTILFGIIFLLLVGIVMATPQIERNLPSETTDDTFTVRYDLINDEKTFAVITDEVTGGCTPATKETVFIYEQGDQSYKEVTYSTPSDEGSCTFSGYYEYSKVDDTKGKIDFQDATITTSGGGPDCTSHTDYACHSGNIYWYDSCGNREDIKKECTENEICEAAQCKDASDDTTPQPDENECKMWEEYNEEEGECGINMTYVYIGGAIIGFMFLMRMMG